MNIGMQPRCSEVNMRCDHVRMRSIAQQRFKNVNKNTSHKTAVS